MISRLPKGTGLLLVGSGVYWLLSSQLIGSPTALAPGLLNGTGEIYILFGVGVACIIGGFPFLLRDFQRLQRLFRRGDGWLFTLPIALAAADLELTLIGLSTGQNIELNPFVSAATTAGPMTVFLFLLSYIGLSEGLGLLMLGFGSRLYASMVRLQCLPYCLVCGVAAFGPFSNIGLIATGSINSSIGNLSGILGSVLISGGAYSRFER